MTTWTAQPTPAATLAAPKPRPRGAARRRSSFLWGILVVATTLVAIFANVLGDEFRYRPDVTRLREQTLAPGTQRLLARLDHEHRIVIAADMKSIDPRARQTARDVLESMASTTDQFTFTFIDTGSTAGLSQYRDLVRTLIERERDTLTKQTASIELGNAGCISLASYLGDTLSAALLGVQDKLPAGTPEATALRRTFEQAAASARVASRDLGDAAQRSGEALKSRLGGMPLPATDLAASTISQALARAVDVMTAAAQETRALAERSNGPAAEAAGTLAPEIERRRDQALIVLEAMRRIDRVDLLRVTRVLETGQAALVIGPPEAGLAAIDLDALFPPGSLLDAKGSTRMDLRRRAEELFAAGLGSLVATRRPIVLLVHAEVSPLLTQDRLFNKLTERLRLRGIDLVEWPVVLQQDPPSLLGVDPDARNPEKARPIVPVILAPDSSAAPGRGGTPGGPQRAERLGEVARQIAERGDNLLVCANPSVLPGQGTADPMVACLARFGLTADTGRPLLRDSVSPRGRAVDTVLFLQSIEESTSGSAPINGAVRGLPTAFSWPIALFERPISDKSRITIQPLYTIDAGPSHWAESEWLRLWQTPPESRALIAQDDLPKMDPSRDSVWPEGRPTDTPQRWLLAAAVQRSELGRKPQRAVIVGSNSWFIDNVTQNAVVVDGRPTYRNPGNIELFEASVYWLAEQDSLIAQSPSALAVPMVASLSDETVARLRLAMILGMPLGVLMLGMLYRLVRG
ncbi:MAG: hypothetical protein HBSAPP03_29090 [Phycisphaerae bacterium]|nr:MAG: hypothetical protein HBSAPP03_29090 [Phycisphaerae bacterium]